MIYELTPVPKPRQTRADVWKKRPSVLRYRAFADEARRLGVSVMNGDRITFHIAMPASWSKAKRAATRGQPHQQRPDLDNMLKALMDAVLPEDCSIWLLGSVQKRWADSGAIEIHRGFVTI